MTVNDLLLKIMDCPGSMEVRICPWASFDDEEPYDICIENNIVYISSRALPEKRKENYHE